MKKLEPDVDPEYIERSGRWAYISQHEEELDAREADLAEREEQLREREREALAHYHAIEARASASAARLQRARLEISQGAMPERVLLEALLGDLDLDVLTVGTIAPPTYLRASELAQRWGTSAGALAQLRYRNTGPAYVNIRGVGIRYNLTVVEEYEAREIVKSTGAGG